MRLLFLIFVAILPFTFALNPTDDIDLSLVRILVLALFGVCLIKSFKERNLLIDVRPRFWLLLFFVLITVFSVFWSWNSALGFRKAGFLLLFLPLYFVAYSLLNNKISRQLFFKVLTWSNFVLATFTLSFFLGQFIFDLDPLLNFIKESLASFFWGNSFGELLETFPSWLVNIKGKNYLRTFLPFPDPHLFALYLNLSLPIIFYLFKKENKLFKKYFYFFAFSFVLLVSLLSFSRAAYLSLLIGFLFFWFNSAPLKKFFKKPALLVIAILFLTILLITNNPVSHRFFSAFDLQEGSNSGRIIMWQKGWEIVARYPLMGVGIGGFAVYVEPTVALRTPIYAHNLLLDFGAETGIFNLMILFMLLICPIFYGLKYPDLSNKIIATSFVIFFVHSIFETPFFSVRVFPLFLILLAIDTHRKKSSF